MLRQLEALIGPTEVAKRGYLKPDNAQIIALFLPDDLPSSKALISGEQGEL